MTSGCITSRPDLRSELFRSAFSPGLFWIWGLHGLGSKVFGLWSMTYF